MVHNTAAALDGMRTDKKKTSTSPWMWVSLLLIPFVVALVGIICTSRHVVPREPGEMQSPQIRAYFKWLEDGGSKVDGLYFKLFKEPGFQGMVRGMACRHDLHDGDIVMQIAEANQLNEKASVIQSQERFSGLSLPSSKVAFFLAEEYVKVNEGMDSHWRPYIDMLPSYKDLARHHPLAASKELETDFHDLCVFSNDDQRCTLPVRHYWEVMETDYNIYRENGGKLLDKDDKISNRALRWAYMICLSRRFAVDGESTLMPVADMLNTGAQKAKNVIWLSNKVEQDGRHYFVVRATGDIQAGDELIQTYGMKSNARLLTTYGMMLLNPVEPNEQYSRGACQRLLKSVSKHYKDHHQKPLVDNLIRLTCESCRDNAADLVDGEALCRMFVFAQDEENELPQVTYASSSLAVTKQGSQHQLRSARRKEEVQSSSK